MATHELDCKGLNCPMPIVRLSQAMRRLEAGEQIIIEADDPAFRADLEAWVRRFGHQIISFDAGPIQRAVVVKS
ncbi:MAG: sulfurtransferase TusA family protein [Myxococcales bacterium]|nr:sulfurtransferase TusA family protein [Myxococcales bacterium]MCB9703107.1 sulfurtransferase TusA family protein [Myxococcales bacterium]